ncbi:hypothetical protein Cenrod_1156 [Candidatus Symbiobacter mobilis CR]|uniref:Uncharacterized protein n=1 Tax=Candidatus Symbiobacter mobilis CR TaxID=946483 RepID=U5NAM2_9BURK|nr:hypothetical protein Cenrod_1156 [Candidatus Symbiobacter mobilis CR]
MRSSAKPQGALCGGSARSWLHTKKTIRNRCHPPNYVARVRNYSSRSCAIALHAEAVLGILMYCPYSGSCAPVPRTLLRLACLLK